MWYVSGVKLQVHFYSTFTSLTSVFGALGMSFVNFPDGTTPWTCDLKMEEVIDFFKRKTLIKYFNSFPITFEKVRILNKKSWQNIWEVLR